MYLYYSCTYLKINFRSPKFRPTFSHSPFEICKSNRNIFTSLPKYDDKTHIVLKSSNQIGMVLIIVLKSEDIKS